MIKKSKRNVDSLESDVSPKKLKTGAPKASKPNIKEENEKIAKTVKEENPKILKKGKFENKAGKFTKPFVKGKGPLNKVKGKGPLNKHAVYPTVTGNAEKTDWNELKKQKKELKLKRKQAKGLYDITLEAKRIAELLRQKQLKGGKEERNKLVNQLHVLLGNKQQYVKLVLIHDTARIVQYLLKFGTEKIRNEVAQELIPISVEMLLSKYGRYCFKNMLKYGNGQTRSAAVKKLYGNAVKLTSHVVSAATFEYAYSTWASSQQKHHLIQEFFGDIYKQAKDDNVKHLKDVYKDSSTMKTAAVQATKGNLSRILNKDLLDSALVQSVLSQYVTECSSEDKIELISQLAPHVVILSNSRDGVRVAMQCIWNGTNKDRKVAMKALKEHVVELCKHEHGHCTIIALLDAADDTVLLNKMIISQILADIKSLATDEWGRKVLLWLVAPADPMHFHPQFIRELEAGRQSSTSKKMPDVRRKELLNYTVPSLLDLVTSEPEFWLSTASIAMLTLAVLKSDSDSDSGSALKSMAQSITDPDWKVKEDETEVSGIEHPGLHMMLKKLAQHDKAISATETATFGKAVVDVISDKVIKLWLTLNRGCFLLVAIYENGTETTQEQMKQKLTSHLNLIKKQSSPGAKILLKKLG